CVTVLFHDVFCLFVSLDLPVRCFLFFFFFQAEDGIRDLYVTGVQTWCSSDLARPAWRVTSRIDERGVGVAEPHHAVGFGIARREIGRASCRERVEIAGVAEAGERKRSRNEETWRRQDTERRARWSMSRRRLCE